jgi:DNA-binding NarL/FixJ family response regulator
MPAIRIIVADDHPLILSALYNLLSSEDDFEIVSSCRNGEEALEAIREHEADILVLDIKMPGRDGLSILHEVQRDRIPIKVVLLTAEITEEEVIECIRLGAKGIVLKDMAPHLLVQSLRKVYAGGDWFERNSFNRAMEKVLRSRGGEEEMQKTLTAREIEIVRMVGKGYRNIEIAQQLFISEGTVKGHLYNIFRKLNLKNRAHLILYAQKKGLA